MAFPRCVIAAADRGLECLKLLYRTFFTLQQIIKFRISIVPHRKEKP